METNLTYSLGLKVSKIIVKNGMKKKLYDFCSSSSKKYKKNIVIVTDENVAKFYQNKISSFVPEAFWIVLNPKKNLKNMQTFLEIYQRLLQFKFDSQGILIALGGGTIGDLAGFVASTYRRGVEFLQIPTTLLSMVDSSIGGKVAIDLPEGKNLMGAFKIPSFIMIDPSFLETLPDREWKCGQGEIIKHGLLADGELLKIDWKNNNNLKEWICRALMVKVRIVEKDPFEKNMRKVLNLGHTFAHAIEKESLYQWSHGEAVAMGLIAMAKLSENLGVAKVPLYPKIRELIQKAGLPFQWKKLQSEKIYRRMLQDKKWKKDRSTFILLEDFEQPIIQNHVPKKEILKALEVLK